MTVAVGLDVGGTKIAAGVVGDDGTVTQLTRVPTPAIGAEVVRALVATASGLLAQARADGREVAGIGVGTGGVVDHTAGRVVAATDLIGQWAGTDVAGPLRRATGLPVRVDNDGNAFGLAEARWGAARDTPDALCVAVGTGVGGGVLLDGAIRRGAGHLAGEFGHLPWPTARRCSCGRTGHVEAVAAGPAMTAIYRERSGRGPDAARDLHAVVERRAGGDPVAAAVLDEGATALGTVLAGLAVALDVGTIVLGGGVASAGAWYRGAVARAVDAVLPHGARVEVRPAAQGPLSSVAGAGALVLSDRAVRGAA